MTFGHYLSLRRDFSEWEVEHGIKKDWLTNEGIPVKSVYTKEDLKGMEHLDYAAGIPPFFMGHIPGCMQCFHGQ